MCGWYRRWAMIGAPWAAKPAHPQVIGRLLARDFIHAHNQSGYFGVSCRQLSASPLASILTVTYLSPALLLWLFVTEDSAPNLNIQSEHKRFRSELLKADVWKIILGHSMITIHTGTLSMFTDSARRQLSNEKRVHRTKKTNSDRGEGMNIEIILLCLARWWQLAVLGQAHSDYHPFCR